jgi:ectoine hydroxylase-related dioxygenase (phytanoyl-CoA dioxygenase family)
MMQVSAENIAQFHQEGYFVLDRVMPDAVLTGLRTECQRYIEKFEAEMEAKGLDKITEFLFSDLMAEISRGTLGENVYLFHEQYVVKAADKDTKFGWHQDSGYIGHYHKPYLSCWCALDDMSEENGTISVLPYERAGMKPDDLFDHVVEAGTNDKVGYHGSDPGIPVIVPAGSIVVFSSRTFHRSGANQTNRMRRSYLAQYSVEPILRKDNSQYWSQAVPLWLDGQRISVEHQTERIPWTPPE